MLLGFSLEDIESEIAKEFMNASAEKQSEISHGISRRYCPC